MLASVLFYLEVWTKINGKPSCTKVKCSTGGPDVEYDYNNILAVYKTMYENASKITLNAMRRK